MGTTFSSCYSPLTILAGALAISSACSSAERDPGVTAGVTPSPAKVDTTPQTDAAVSAAVSQDHDSATATKGPAAQPTPGVDAGPGTDLSPDLAKKYAGSGFVVHEWGTNTTVVGSDGSLQRGLHHEGDDLPPFVYDRLKAAKVLALPSVDKMETPVDYFYSDKPITATVKVSLPDGILTQWYPAVTSFAPAVLFGLTGMHVDPVFEMHYPYVSPACSLKYGAGAAGGLLNWGTVKVLAPDAIVELPEAPLDQFTWSYARQVKANAIQVDNPSGLDAANVVLRGPQTERFLFYRGLGNFPPPVQVTAESPPGAQTTVRLASPLAGGELGAVFVLNVNGDRGAFSIGHPTISTASSYGAEVPSLEAGKPVDLFVADLATAMTRELIATGLYDDESIAMVNTWRRQWFATPGVRVLYFAPTKWIDTIAPLTIDPKPQSVVRVMVMRVEVLTPSVERDDSAFASLFSGSDSDVMMAQTHFAQLGRFAEPRLRRALTMVGGSLSPRAATFLAQIEAPNTSFAVGQ